jgi:hypothetical protein
VQPDHEVGLVVCTRTQGDRAPAALVDLHVPSTALDGGAADLVGV